MIQLLDWIIILEYRIRVGANGVYLSRESTLHTKQLWQLVFVLKGPTCQETVDINLISTASCLRQISIEYHMF